MKNGDTALPCRPLWGLHRCMAVLEHASFACQPNEERLVALRVPDQATPHAHQQQQLPGSAAAARTVSASAPALPMDAEDAAVGTQAAACSMGDSAPAALACSPPGKGRLAAMRDSQDNTEGSQGAGTGQGRPLAAQQPSGEDAAQGPTFPAWLVTQASAFCEASWPGHSTGDDACSCHSALD